MKKAFMMVGLALTLAACGGGGLSLTGRYEGTLTGTGTAYVRADFTDAGGNTAALGGTFSTCQAGFTNCQGNLAITGTRNGSSAQWRVSDQSGSLAFNGTISGNVHSGTVTVTVGDQTGTAQFNLTKK